VRSDILHRAIPWVGLMLRERIFRSDLNTRSGNVLSVVLAWLIPLFAAAGALGLGFAFAGVGVAAAVATIGVLNAPFIGAARREFGLWFAARAVAFLPVMYFYHGVGLIAGVWTYLRGGSVAKRRAAPEAIYEMREGPQTRTA
jgi:hypothetical protein